MGSLYALIGALKPRSGCTAISVPTLLVFEARKGKYSRNTHKPVYLLP